MEGIRRGLKKGRDAEYKLASQLLSVLAITLGTDGEELFDEFAPILTVTINDPTASAATRCEVSLDKTMTFLLMRIAEFCCYVTSW